MFVPSKGLRGGFKQTKNLIFGFGKSGKLSEFCISCHTSQYHNKVTNNIEALKSAIYETMSCRYATLCVLVDARKK